MLSSHLHVWQLLEEYPEADQVLSWYGVRLHSDIMNLSIRQLCEELSLDIVDVLTDIADAADEHWPEDPESSDELDDDPDESWEFELVRLADRDRT